MINSDEFLLKWLNEEVKLNPHVQNIVKEFSTGFRFAEVLYNLKIITENQFKKFSKINNVYNIKENFKLLKQYFREKFELEIRNEEFNDVINKDICKAVIILYKLKNSISKKNINFFSMKMSLDKLTNEEIHKKVEEIINYEYYNIFEKDLLYDILTDVKNENENNKFGFSSTIKSGISSNIFQNTFSFKNTLSTGKIDEKPEIQLKNEKESNFPKKILFGRNNKNNFNMAVSKKEFSKFKLPIITNVYKSAEISSKKKKFIFEKGTKRVFK